MSSGARVEDHREPGVEANARLTAATGLLLAVMLAAEGFTIVAIHPLLPRHVARGLALIPLQAHSLYPHRRHPGGRDSCGSHHTGNGGGLDPLALNHA